MRSLVTLVLLLAPAAHAAVGGWYQTGSAEVSGVADDVTIRFGVEAGLARTEITKTLTVGRRHRVLGTTRADGAGVVGVQQYDESWTLISDQPVKIAAATDRTIEIPFARDPRAAHVRVYARKDAGAGAFDVAHLRVVAGRDPRLAYAPPTLVDPITIDLEPGLTTTKLNPARDYIVRLPRQKKIGATNLLGGHHVVIVGGHVTIPASGPKGDLYQRGIYVKEATGTVHIEGVLIDGSGGGDSDAIAISAPLATVQIQNVRVDGITGRNSGWHADLIQPWGGVRELRVYNFTGSSYYQGLQIPIDQGPIATSTLENVNLISVGEQTKDTGGQLLWIAHGCRDYPIRLHEVYVQPRAAKAFGAAVFPGVNQSACPVVITGTRGAWPSLRVTGAVDFGAPADGDFVPPGVAGVNYVAPGYR